MLRPSVSHLPRRAATYALLLSGCLAAFTAIAAGAVAPAGPQPPDGSLAQPYSFTLAASGGASPYTFLVVSGNLPLGLALSPAGVLAGTPTQSGLYRFTIRAVDSAAASGTSDFALRIGNSAGLQISTGDLPPAQRGIAYSSQLSAQGGSAPYFFDLLPGSGALPLGLTLDVTGKIQGNALVAGVFPLVWRVTDRNGVSSVTASALVVTANTLVINNTSIAAATLGSSYTQTLTAAGGTAPYQFAISSGALPVGLILSSSGVLSGTPSVAGSFPFFVRVTDAAAQTAQASFSLTVSSGQFRINESFLPSAQIGVAYTQQFSSQGGVAPVSYVVSSGALPAGINISSSGMLTGSAITAGSYPVSIRAVDASGQSTSQSITLYVNASAFTISGAITPPAIVGQPYAYAPAVNGGSAPLTISIIGGSLPPGLQISAAGAISGTPTASGAYGFALRAQDAAGQVAQTSLSINVSSNALSLNAVGLPLGQVGTAYTTTISATNGAGPFAYTLVGGSLPPGLTLATNGNISGTPTAPGIYQITLKVSDANTNTAQQSLTVFITAPGFAVTTNAIPSAQLNQPYTAVLLGFGGTAPYNFQLTSGSLPPGIALSSVGVLSGTPTAAGSYPITLRAADAANSAFVLNYNLIVNAPAIALAPASLPSGQSNVPYSLSLVASGGVGPYLFTVASGGLPPGLTLSSNGLLSGSPTMVGPFAFNILVTDSTGAASLFTLAQSISSGSLAIVSQGIPSGILNTDYFASLIAAGGSSPYAFTLASGSLPSGITLSPVGTLSGTPGAIGTYPLTFTVKDSAGNSTNANFTLVISAPGSLAISTAALPTARTNQTYSTVIAATGGRAPYSFTLTGGSLPAGVQLNADGSLTGKVSTDGIYTFIVRVTDALGATAQATLNLTATSSNLSIVTVSFVNGRVGEAFQQGVQATGGNAPYTFSLRAGVLPPGLTLSTDGIIAGTPTSGGAFPIVIRVTDAAGIASQSSYSLLIGTTNLAFTNTTLPTPYIGSQYYATLQAAGGVAPYQFSIQTGALPSGLSLAPSGQITGSAAAASASVVTFRVVDASGASASTTIALTPSQSVLQLGFTAFPAARVGQFYVFTPTATGGSGTYVFSVAAPLPRGLFLTPVGNIVGTPKVAGTYTVVVRAQDSTGALTQNSFPFTVLGDGFQIIQPLLPNARVNQPFVYNFSTSGTNGDVKYDLASGALPPGLTLATSGMLSGTPTVAGAYRFAVRATDSIGVTTLTELTLNVAAF